MRKGAVLAEVSSIKRRAVEALREAASLGVKPLSIHPMFGPSTESLRGRTIAVIPVLNKEAEAELTSRFFDEARIVVSDQRKHDEAMAVVLSLTYFMNLAFAQVVGEGNLMFMKSLGGTTFRVQLAIAESVVSEDLRLVASLLRENSFTETYVNRFLDEAEKIRDLIKGNQKDFDELHHYLKGLLSIDPDYSRADEMRYNAYKALSE
jgi:prephenate dehydrogenase